MKNYKKLEDIIAELSDLGYDYIDGYVSSVIDRIRSIHRQCGRERIATYCTYDVKGCRHCSRATSNAGNKFIKVISEQDGLRILELNKNNKTNTEISREMGFSTTAVRLFLKKNNLTSYIKETEVVTKNCKYCGDEFTVKLVSKNPNRHNYCSSQCGHKAGALAKNPYTKEDIDRVVELKKQNKTIKEIEDTTQVNRNKIKKITQENELFLTKEQGQSNAYKSKLAKNNESTLDVISKMEEEVKNIADYPNPFEISDIIKKVDDKYQIKMSYGWMRKHLNDNFKRTSERNKDLRDYLDSKDFKQYIKNIEYSQIIKHLKEKFPDRNSISLYNSCPKFLADSSVSYIKRADKYEHVRKFILSDREQFKDLTIPQIKEKLEERFKIQIDYRTLSVWITYNYHLPYKKCSGFSKEEDIIIDFIKELNPKITIEKNNRTLIKPKEVDIYVPQLKLGIEYCGLRWHSEDFTPDTSYHYNKMVECNKQGIRLITIFEDEWLCRQPQVKSFLKSVIGKCEKKIEARKCELKEVEKETTKEFLDCYHIQGKTRFEISFGLYYENELVGLVTGSKHHRQDVSGNPFVLNRLVFKDGYLVVGGSSRLTKALVGYAKTHGYQQLISWSDNRWSEGKVYEKCGFILEEDLKPDYCYITDRYTRESKQSNKKINLIEKGAPGTMENTELELAQMLGYSRIFDCGKKRWVIKF